MAYSTISKPGLHFNTKLYTGNGSTNAITGVGFQPDWVWIKNRVATSSHNVFDAVRGVTKTIFTNTADAEATEASRLSAFNSDGFTINGDTSNQTNANGSAFVSWNWKAGGGQGTSNTDGSINTTYTSVNTTAGFSISLYTGTGSNATVGHGLGAVPKMIILKELNPSTTRSWRVYYENMGNNKVMYLDLTNAEVSDSTAFNSTTPTSSVFSLGTSIGTNGSGKNYIAYCFAEVKGFSKFGKYIGNGNANGTFVYTGFKPALIMMKRKDSTGSWMMYDATRDSFNLTEKYLRADESDSEGTGSSNRIDILSNGVKLRATGSFENASGGTYVYMAFAENPLVANVGANGIPATAR